MQPGFGSPQTAHSLSSRSFSRVQRVQAHTEDRARVLRRSPPPSAPAVPPPPWLFLPREAAPSQSESSVSEPEASSGPSSSDESSSSEQRGADRRLFLLPGFSHEVAFRLCLLPRLWFAVEVVAIALALLASLMACFRTASLALMLALESSRSLVAFRTALEVVFKRCFPILEERFFFSVSSRRPLSSSEAKALSRPSWSSSFRRSSSFSRISRSFSLWTLRLKRRPSSESSLHRSEAILASSESCS
mmetsp:Transcript_27612/g.60929  ORF Transcript_27612/g.60929 Transcript_27612/m.60929 type:complete len:247 (-) Transcript_27612:285-1025(-)